MNVFAYGSLMFPEVWTRVVAGVYRQAPATAHGYRRLAVKGETYPGMVAAAGERVEGVVYFDLAEDDLAALDAFEGADYRRIEVALDTSDQASVDAHAYLYLPTERLAGESWLPEAFEIRVFIETYCPTGESGPAAPPAEDSPGAPDRAR